MTTRGRGYPPRVDQDQARERLDEERTRLQRVVASISEDEVSDETETASFGELSSNQQHQADLGTETFEREKDISVLERVEQELADVDHALRRLDEGTYGICEVCGRQIDDARLDAVPAARLCLAHEEQAEGGGLPLR